MFFLLFCNHKGNELGSNQKLDRPQPAELFVFMDMETSIEVLTLIWKTVSGRITFPLSKRLFLKYVALIFLIFILYFESACSAACSLWHFVLTFLSQRFFFFSHCYVVVLIDFCAREPYPNHWLFSPYFMYSYSCFTGTQNSSSPKLYYLLLKSCWI